MSNHDHVLAQDIKRFVFELSNEDMDFDPLMQLIGDAKIVMLGESTHGSQEFYAARAKITSRLIREKNFAAIAVEADWPDAYRVNRFLRGLGDDPDAEKALTDFIRFPVWMWRNTVIEDILNELKEYNDALPELQKIGFYGLDLYSLYSSMEAVIKYLEEVDPDAAKRAKKRYGCFEQFGSEGELYGLSASSDISKRCQDEVVEELKEMQRKSLENVRRQGFAADEEFFYAEQNARLAKNAEEYYRSIFGSTTSSWNLRDQHMAQTLEELMLHIGKFREPKIVVWEHNSHIGDARATSVSDAGEFNVGQLVRQKHSYDAVLVGFTTDSGTVSAASDWGEIVERKHVRPAIEGSYEHLFHSTAINQFYLDLRNLPDFLYPLKERRLERAIGVIYLPQTERYSHYFDADLTSQFDAVFHFDHTNALKPLEITPEWQRGEVPETMPTGL
jgi:erythromycin esterase-like protein